MGHFHGSVSDTYPQRTSIRYGIRHNLPCPCFIALNYRWGLGLPPYLENQTPGALEPDVAYLGRLKVVLISSFIFFLVQK